MTKAQSDKHIWTHNNCAVIVAHPDDETLWAGGLMLMHPNVKWTILTICRKNDKDRAPRFFKALEKYKAVGFMADLDDGPEQTLLDSNQVQQTIELLLPAKDYDIIITHNTSGEYTRHLRHEETAQAVMALWKANRLTAGQLWTFAYEDGNRKYLPRAIKNADLLIKLNKEIWQKKYNILTRIYGFDKNSFEAKTTPEEEAFRNQKTAC